MPLIKRLAAAFLFSLVVLFYAPILRRLLAFLPEKIFEIIAVQSFAHWLLSGYLAICPLYRRTFWIVFIAMNVVFGFHTAQYLWGGECWDFIFFKMSNALFVGQGRYTQNIFNLFLQNNDVLPVLNNLISFTFLALSSVGLCIYFNLPGKLWMWVVLGLVLTLQPFTLARMYYTYNAPGLFIAVAIGIFGLVCAKKAGQRSKSKFSAYGLCLLSAICIHWGIASYQPFINTALILLCGGMIVILVDEKCTVKTAIFKARFMIIATVFAAISYKLTLDILKELGIAWSAYYSSQMLPFSEMPARFLLAVQRGLVSLFAYKAPFMELNIAFLFSLFAVFFFLLFANLKGNIGAKCGIFVLFLGAVFASQTHIALANFLSTNIVTDYYGVLFLRVLVVALVFKLCSELVVTKHIAQNVVFVLSILTIWQCIVQDLQAQKMQKITMQRDMLYLNRVIARIENSENFDYNKKYVGIMFGEPANNYTEPFLYNILTRDKMPFNVMMSKNVFSYFLRDDDTEKENINAFKEIVKRLDSAGILENLQVFPHKNSIVVFEDVIVFVASEGDLFKWQKQAQQWRTKIHQ